MSAIKKTSMLLMAVSVSFFSAYSYASGESGLVAQMGKLQYFMHKTGLALKAQNTRLAGFYVHELEETLEELEDFGRYKSHDIGKLIEKLLMPEFEQLEKQVKHGQAATQWRAYENVINSCNGCHKATAHEFIRIEYNNANPYMQSFDK